MMPISPPNSDSTIASTRNCSQHLALGAPMASRMPISRVRSVTETSMMFMMPMPPTSRLTAATADSRPVSTPVVAGQRLVICFMSQHREIVFLAGADVAPLAHQALDVGLDLGGRRRRRGPRRRWCAMSLLPAMRRWKACERHQDEIVLVGAEARCALGLQHADHLAGDCLIRIAAPDRVCRRRTACLPHRLAEDADGARRPRSSPSWNCRPGCELPVARHRNSRCRCRSPVVDGSVAVDRGHRFCAIGGAADARPRRTAPAMASTSAGVKGLASPLARAGPADPGPDARSEGWCRAWQMSAVDLRGRAVADRDHGDHGARRR